MLQLFNNFKDYFLPSLLTVLSESYQEYYCRISKILQHEFKFSLKRDKWHCQYQQPPDISKTIWFFFLSFFFFAISKNFNVLLNSWKPGENGEQHDSQWIHQWSPELPEFLFTSLELLPSSHCCLPASGALGIHMRTSEKKESILLDRKQSGFSPKPDFRSRNKTSTALVGVLPRSVRASDLISQ